VAVLGEELADGDVALAGGERLGGRAPFGGSLADAAGAACGSAAASGSGCVDGLSARGEDFLPRDFFGGFRVFVAIAETVNSGEPCGKRGKV
jgi:hypothetical protein